ncbi:CatB-related O-acetyltransferase [Brevundimonas vesicularis]|uniref:CatB-related O-acetyltransferase n=1 Tax=Brevundimonas vesicularis TaxID=41276 RepID=UPI0022EC33BF|nr:CatB-related O-acetyltransferase [Brevundimonas vesicularis]WBT07557.1 CatB-related O-acetyltransferase [Brevundimonas vesicularis]
MRPGWASVAGAWRVESHSPVKETIIGNDVWIGAGAYIKSGVSIGDGAIIGARAVVTRDVPPFSIMVGNPGKIIRHRLDEMLGREVQASQWWDFSPQQLDGCPFNRPKDALEFVGRLRANGELAYRGGYVKILPSGAAFTPNGT